jgi:hypothetical protein
MYKTVALPTLIVALAFASACGSSVEATGAGGGGSGGSQLDQGCYDDCVAKATTPEECTAYCTSGTGGKGAGGKGAGGKGSTSTSGTAGAGGGFDVPLEKACIECWDDNAAGACSKEYDTCAATLACIQLRNCPFSCIDKSVCVEECNEIIPTGLEPLTALVQCMACAGGPCADACSDSVTLSYCE